MNKEILNKAKKIAKDAAYHDVKYLGKWKESEVIEPIFTDGVIHFIGLPMFLLVKNGKIEWSKPEDCFEILDYFASDEYI